MKFLLGSAVVILLIIFPYLEMGGSLFALLQPGEAIIIIGSAIGSFIIANPRHIVFATVKELKYTFKALTSNKKSYEELLLFLVNMFKKIKSEGILVIESALDKPQESELFTQYPTLSKNHKAIEFICDYMRLISMGMESWYQLDELMNQEIELIDEEGESITGAVNTVGDAMPALGIVAAVLGVINTMNKINSPPDVLGNSIGGALVGTFLGVLLAYAFINPIGKYLEKHHESRMQYIKCIKTAIISYAQGNAPIIIAEFSRKVIPEHLRPSFGQLETLLNNAK